MKNFGQCLSIDDIRIYDRALSESEIQEFYNGDSGTCSYTDSDIDGDKKISLPEAIHALQVTSGITEPAIK